MPLKNQRITPMTLQNDDDIKNLYLRNMNYSRDCHTNQINYKKSIVNHVFAVTGGAQLAGAD
jgi:hypothetical protein